MDDRLPNLFALREILDAPQFHFVDASSEAALLSEVRKDVFAVILIAAGTPGLDAGGMVRKIRSAGRCRLTPIILLNSGEMDLSQLEQAYLLGAVEVLPQPLMPAILKAKVQGYVRLFAAAEERLRESEERFAGFMQHIPGLAWIKDAQGRYVYVNDAAEQAFRTSRAELYGRTDHDVFDPETAAQFVQNDRQAISSGTGIQVVEALQQADGEVHYSLVSKFPIFGPDGQVALVGGMAIDITEQRRTEELLREADRHKDELLATLRDSEQFHRAIADLSTDYAFAGIFGSEGSLRIVTVTEGFSKFYGITLAEMNARGGWGTVIHPDDLPRVGTTIERLLAGQTDRGEVRGLHADGTVKWQLYLTVPVRDVTNTRTVGLYGAATDVTAERQLNERLREQAESLSAILSASADNIYLFDNQGRYRYVSLGGARVLGLEPEAMTGKRWQDLGLPTEIMERFDTVRERAISTGEPQRNDVSFTSPDGEVHHFEYTISPVRGSHGGFDAAVVVSRNDTERKRAEEALRDADRRKDEFLATLAHELRNPLAPIRNSLEILKMPGVGAAAARQTREMMERQVQHLVRLVDDLLDVSRVMRGKVELRKELVDLATIVARAIETARPLIDAHNHQLRISFPDESLVLHADPVRLTQVVGNLLANSAKYTEANGQISVTACHEGASAVLRVRDNGIGISPHVLPHIFDLFVQADHGSAKAQGGLGIGLTLVKSLVEMHGGTVESHSGGLRLGCEFVVRLPLSVQTCASAIDQNDERVQVNPNSGYRLLVVDDNRDAAISLALLLELMGHEVRVAHDGPSSLEIAMRFSPQLIFLDIGMPGMDGLEVARRIRQTPGLGNTILAAVTGWGQQHDRRRTADAGFDYHLVKPPEAKAIEELLAELAKRTNMQN